MTYQITTSIQIKALPAEIWKILMDFDHYPEWNSFVKSITGDIKVGNQIKVVLGGMTFKPTVLTLDENLEFKWLGHLFFKGLFDGQHRFYIKDNGDGTCQFEQSESFKGILVKLFASSLEKNTKKGFEDMNRELKQRVENQ